jgi:hypothetical protein
MLPPPSPGPSPPALKTILHQTVRPFCSVFRTRLGIAAVIERQNDQLLIRTFPLLDSYASARGAQSDTDAYFSARKLDALNRQLSGNLDRLLPIINSRFALHGAPSDDDVQAARMQANLGQIYAHQRQAQQALAQFVGDALYAVVDDVRDLRAHLAPVGAVSMPGLPELIKADVADAGEWEQQLQPLLTQAATQCT